MTPLISVSDENPKPPSSLPLNVYITVRTFFDDLTSGSANFIINFAKYIYLRLRISLIWGSVSIVVLRELLSDVKDWIVTFMFWGRSPFYRFAVMAFAVVLIGLLFSIQQYREPQLTVSAKTVDVKSIAVAKNDLIVEAGSTQTLIPKSRGRLDTVTYVVQPGDSISGVADKFDLKQSTIMWSNGLTTKSILKPGQKLKIPEGDGVLHRVAKKDTLISIAKKYDSNPQAIAEYNWIDNPNQLPVGDSIFVPNGRIKVVIPIKSGGGTSGGGNNSGGGGYIPGGGGGADPGGKYSLIWPISGHRGTVTQCPSWYHKALDIADHSAPLIVAARSGTVVFAGVKDPYGYAREIVLSHGNGLYTQYAHLSAWAVRTGQHVSAGQVIGRMGATGLATGIHLHFEVRIGGSSYTHRVINPQYYLTTRVCR